MASGPKQRTSEVVTKSTSEAKKAAAKRKQEKNAAFKNFWADDYDDKLVMGFKLRFTDSLIMHKFSQKAMETILRGQAGLPDERRPKVPKEEIELATMRNMRGEPCILPAAFKKATLSGSSGIEAVKGLRLRSQLWILGKGVPIKYESMISRVDMVGIGPWDNRTVDVRFRPEFIGVTCTIIVKFPATMTQQMLEKLLNRGGEQGVGEWRPPRSGHYGTYEVAGVVTDLEEITEALNACSSPVPSFVIPDWAMELEISPVILARIMNGGNEEAVA